MPGSGSFLFPNIHLRLMLKYLQLDLWRRRLIFCRFALESPASFRSYNNHLRRSISLATLTAWQSPLITGISRGRRDNVPGPAPWVVIGGPCPPAERTMPSSDWSVPSPQRDMGEKRNATVSYYYYQNGEKRLMSHESPHGEENTA